MIYRILWIHGIFVKTYKQLLYSFLQFNNIL